MILKAESFRFFYFYNTSCKHPDSQSYSFYTSRVQIWELGHKAGWAPKNWCFWTVLVAKTPESSLDSTEIKPVHPKGNQPWIFTARTDAEAKALMLWPPDAKSVSLEKDPDAGNDWGQEKKGRERMRWLDDITDSMDISLSKFWQMVKNREAWPNAVHRVAKSKIKWTLFILILLLLVGHFLISHKIKIQEFSKMCYSWRFHVCPEIWSHSTVANLLSFFAELHVWSLPLLPSLTLT